MNVCYPDEQVPTTSKSVKVDKLTERLGEFFLGPEKKEEDNVNNGREGENGGGRHIKKSRKSISGGDGALSYGVQESDGLTEGARNAL